jgi:hypothetical protein
LGSSSLHFGSGFLTVSQVAVAAAGGSVVVEEPSYKILPPVAGGFVGVTGAGQSESDEQVELSDEHSLTSFLCSGSQIKF